VDETDLVHVVQFKRYDPMNLLTTVLQLLIGALAGGLLVLILDTYYLGQRLQKAISAKRQMQAVLRRAERKLANSQLREQKLAQQLAMTTDRVEVTSEEDPVHLELEKARVEINTLRDNLTRVTDHVDELHDERQVLRQDLAATKARAETQREYLGRLESDLRELRQSYEETCERLKAAEMAKKRSETELRLAREKVEMTGALQLELHQVRFQLKTAEARVNQLEARQGVTPMPSQQKGESQARRAVESAVATQEASASQPPESEPEAEPDTSRTADSGEQDQLKKVRGIGPVYAQRLHEAGINDLSDLADQDPGQISDIVGFKGGHRDRAAAWIEEARSLLGG
jgi:predicted flap endonuclease-1-like 5' DNA nuclease/archaellum component FlaC